MENNELLQAISDMIDKKLEPIKEDIQSLRNDNISIKEDIQSLRNDNISIKEDIQSLRNEQAQMKSDLERQIKRTERSLKAEIVESENLILDEVSRVHNILNQHRADKSVHTA